MKIKANLRKILPGISIYAVLLALIIITLFQYQWVISSAEKDISELYKSLTYSIEIKLIGLSENHPILEKENNLTLDLNNEELITEINIIKNELIEIYGTESIISISQIRMNRTPYLIELVNNKWEDPKNISKELLGIIPSIRPGINNVSIIDNYQNPEEIGFVFLLSNNLNEFIIFKLDIEEYYTNLIKDVSKDILNNYEVTIYTERPQNIKIINDEDYTYSPLNTIKTILLKNRQRWFSTIPFHIISIPLGPGKSKNDPRRPPEELRNERPSMIYIDILDNGKSLIETKENSLTLQWLLILTLIIGIGIAYILILSQIAKLKQLRLKEKEFIATITHELRTPLTVIQAASDNIKSGILKKDRVMQYGQLITDQSIRLASMIEGILLFSRLEGKAEQPPYLEVVKFSEIKMSLEIFATSLMNTSNNIIKIEFDNLPEKVISHRDTIELILTNLISNSNKHAFKNGESGKITVSGNISSEHSLKIKVIDNGVGIDSKEKKEIFDPFFRGKRSLKYQIKGTGLGLFLSQRKANLIGGTLKVDDNTDRGTIFTLKIPHTPVNEDTLNEKDINN